MKYFLGFQSSLSENSTPSFIYLFLALALKAVIFVSRFFLLLSCNICILSSEKLRFSLEKHCWSTSLSNNEAFALQFDRGNRFALVYMKDGKSNVSTGNVVRESGDLVFKDDGGTALTCGITWRHSNAFQLVIKGANGQPAMRMELKKR